MNINVITNSISMSNSAIEDYYIFLQCIISSIDEYYVIENFEELDVLPYIPYPPREWKSPRTNSIMTRSIMCKLVHDYNYYAREYNIAKHNATNYVEFGVEHTAKQSAKA